MGSISVSEPLPRYTNGDATVYLIAHGQMELPGIGWVNSVSYEHVGGGSLLTITLRAWRASWSLVTPNPL